jgi:hypothetical protein
MGVNLYYSVLTFEGTGLETVWKRIGTGNALDWVGFGVLSARKGREGYQGNEYDTRDWAANDL